MTGPLCIDLFCGLLQSKFFRCADAPIDQFVTGRAQNPDHVRLCVFHFPPCPITLESRPVGQLQHPALSAGLARFRKFWMLPSNPHNDTGILVRPAGIVNRRNLRVSLVKTIPAVFGTLYSAVLGAVSSVTVGRLNSKRSSTYFACLRVLSGIVLLSPSQPSHSRLTSEGAVFLINPTCGEFRPATAAE